MIGWILLDEQPTLRYEDKQRECLRESGMGFVKYHAIVFGLGFLIISPILIISIIL